LEVGQVHCIIFIFSVNPGVEFELVAMVANQEPASALGSPSGNLARRHNPGDRPYFCFLPSSFEGIVSITHLQKKNYRDQFIVFKQFDIIDIYIAIG
jgi:hypothetical protein